MHIAPQPTDEEAAAIAIALEMLWPKPTTNLSPQRPNLAWRFSGRQWHDKARWGRGA
jgi:hypothetical protein